jgi:hypothetical protein
MSLESAIEKKIREAIERGEFDNLPGKGRPINLEAYFNAPEDLRMAFSLLRSNEFVPAEVDMMKELSKLKERLEKSTDETERKTLAKAIQDERLALTLQLESRRRKG